MNAQFFTLKNNSLQATFTNYGGRLVSLHTPDKNGTLIDVVTGFSTINDYLNAKAPYYGALIGRFANRIANGQFSLNGQGYQLPINNGVNSLHGGNGFHNKVWEAQQPDEQTLLLNCFSADGEEGYPGAVNTKVTYRLIDNELHIDYEAHTTAPTIINLTNHAYFNLNGEGNGDILKHTVEINADNFTPVNANLIPVGLIAPVANTPFDFNEPHVVAERIAADDEQLHYGKGYDHNYVLNKAEANELTFAARATGDITKITMEVYTTEPGMQFYSGNFMNGANTFKGGTTDAIRTAFAMETQHFPDSPNHPTFPSTVLNPGNLFKSTTIYKFS